MARISAVSLKQQPEHYTLTVRKTIDFMAEYAAFAAQALDETSLHLHRLGLLPISGPIACFHNTQLKALDVECGWQLATPVESSGHLLCTHVPGRRVATAIDLGPYEQQDPTLSALLQWVQREGYEASGPICYRYLNDTDRPESEYLTEMFLPLR